MVEGVKHMSVRADARVVEYCSGSVTLMSALVRRMIFPLTVRHARWNLTSVEVRALLTEVMMA